MEKYDSEMAARVWQRVQGEAEAVSPPLPSANALAAAELAQAAALLQLSRQLQGREKAVVRHLYEEEKTHADVLRGIHFLITGRRAPIRTAPAEGVAPEIALRKCYAAALRAMKEYGSRSKDAEYGSAFAALARQERAHCTMLLEILGSLKG